jgi:hypothetical protein
LLKRDEGCGSCNPSFAALSRAQITGIIIVADRE